MACPLVLGGVRWPQGVEGVLAGSERGERPPLSSPPPALGQVWGT